MRGFVNEFNHEEKRVIERNQQRQKGAGIHTTHTEGREGRVRFVCLCDGRLCDVAERVGSLAYHYCYQQARAKGGGREGGKTRPRNCPSARACIATHLFSRSCVRCDDGERERETYMTTASQTRLHISTRHRGRGIQPLQTTTYTRFSPNLRVCVCIHYIDVGMHAYLPMGNTMRLQNERERERDTIMHVLRHRRAPSHAPADSACEHLRGPHTWYRYFSAPCRTQVK